MDFEGMDVAEGIFGFGFGFGFGNSIRIFPDDGKNAPIPVAPV
jgi:hypothetical protein